MRQSRSLADQLDIADLCPPALPMADTELPITGYLDRFSHRPGETFTAYVSVRDGGPYRARLVRVLSGDPNPDGPGMRFEDLVASLRPVVRRTQAADPSRFVRCRRRRPDARYERSLHLDRAGAPVWPMPAGAAWRRKPATPASLC